MTAVKRDAAGNRLCEKCGAPTQEQLYCNGCVKAIDDAIMAVNIEELRAENERLREENQMLKKNLAALQRKQRDDDDGYF